MVVALSPVLNSTDYSKSAAVGRKLRIENIEN